MSLDLDLDLTAAAVLARGLCTPQCLLSAGREAAACTCPCRQRLHGALTRVIVPGSGQAVPAPTPPHSGQGDLLAHLAERTA